MTAALLETSSRINLSQYRGLGRPRPPAEVPLRSFRRPGLLLADNDVLVRSLLGAGLQQEGYAVWVAGDSCEALELYGYHAGEIDLVLLDVRLSGGGGLQTLQALHWINPELRCCFLNWHTGVFTEQELLTLGATAILPKTLRATKVVPVLRKLLGQPQAARQKRRTGLTFLFGWLGGVGQSRPHPETGFGSACASVAG